MIKKWAACAACAAALVFPSMSLGQASPTHTTTDMPVDLIGYFLCTPQYDQYLYTAHGTAHVQYTYVTTPSGVNASEYHLVLPPLTVTDPDGNDYRLMMQQGNINVTFSADPFAAVFSGPYRYTLRGQGSVADYTGWSNFHLTLHPDGTITGFVYNTVSNCR